MYKFHSLCNHLYNPRRLILRKCSPLRDIVVQRARHELLHNVDVLTRLVDVNQLDHVLMPQLYHGGCLPKRILSGHHRALLDHYLLDGYFLVGFIVGGGVDGSEPALT